MNILLLHIGDTQTGSLNFHHLSKGNHSPIYFFKYLGTQLLHVMDEKFWLL